MSVIERLASSLGRRDEVPNQGLARSVEYCHSRWDKSLAQGL